MDNPIRLTQTVTKGGCAAKLPADALKGLLSALDLPRPVELAVGIAHFDDAALWDLGKQYSVHTLDFFTPIVDDPFDFGAIAAANALSDVFAMGGSPKLALSILAFPAKTLPIEIIAQVMKGAVEKIREAGACLAGGHTIDDDTLKFGLAVTGFVEKGKEWTNAGAKAGDVLILTKALGTGTITSALKNGVARPEWVRSATQSMCQLNDAPELLKGIRVNAAVDITGFGLAGHGLQMARASGKRFVFDIPTLPVLSGARECLEQKVINRAHHSNRDYVQEATVFENVGEVDRWLTFDPQTSGGLLLSLPAPEAPQAIAALRGKFAQCTQIGEVVEGTCDVLFRGRG